MRHRAINILNAAGKESPIWDAGWPIFDRGIIFHRTVTSKFHHNGGISSS